MKRILNDLNEDLQVIQADEIVDWCFNGCTKPWMMYNLPDLAPALDACFIEARPPLRCDPPWPHPDVLPYGIASVAFEDWWTPWREIHDSDAAANRELHGRDCDPAGIRWGVCSRLYVENRGKTHFQPEDRVLLVGPQGKYFGGVKRQRDRPAPYSCRRSATHVRARRPFCIRR